MPAWVIRMSFCVTRSICASISGGAAQNTFTGAPRRAVNNRPVLPCAPQRLVAIDHHVGGAAALGVRPVASPVMAAASSVARPSCRRGSVMGSSLRGRRGMEPVACRPSMPSYDGIPCSTAIPSRCYACIRAPASGVVVMSASTAGRTGRRCGSGNRMERTRPKRRRSIVPWRDRQGRFSWLKAATLAGCIAPGAVVAYWLATDAMSARPVHTALLWIGLWTVRFVMIALAITPAAIVLDWPKISAGAADGRGHRLRLCGVAFLAVCGGREFPAADGGFGDRVAVLSDHRVRRAAGLDGAGGDLHRCDGAADGARLETAASARLCDRRAGAAALFHPVEGECQRAGGICRAVSCG